MAQIRLLQVAEKASGDQSMHTSKMPGDSRKHYVEVLFRKYHDSLLNYLIRMSGSREDAAELLQETYIRLLQQENLSRIETNARAYLFKIATNLMLDKLRKDKARRQDQHQAFIDADHPDGSPSAAKQLDWSRALDIMKEAIREFSPRSRRVFILYHFKHKTYNEIADILGVTTRTVERDMSLTMALCKERLKGII